MIPTLERLRALRAGQANATASLSPLPSVGVLPLDWRLAFEERAAIREFEGGETRAVAEGAALQEIIAAM